MTKKIEKPKREVTKRQLSRWQREKKRMRIIRALGISIIIIVLVIVGAGWYLSQYRPLRQTVIKVNDTKFDMNYYIKMLEYYGKGQSIYDLYSLADQLVNVIEQNELMRQGASELGISVSDQLVDKELENHNPPLSKDYRDVVRAGLIANKLLSDYFEPQVPVSTEQRHIMAMLLESESQALQVRARLNAGEDFGKLAAELSLDSLSKTENGDLGWRPRDVLAELLVTSVPGDYAFNAAVGVLSHPIPDDEVLKSVSYWIVNVLERELDTEQANVQVILLANEEEARQVKNRLNAGEDFATLAKELSLHEASKGNDGNLGLITKGTLSPALDEFIFNSETELNTPSDPIRDETTWTRGGYWLLKVIEQEDDKEIEESDRDLLRTKLYNEWIYSLWDNPENEVTSYLDSEQKAWAVEKVMGS